MNVFIGTAEVAAAIGLTPPGISMARSARYTILRHPIRQKSVPVLPP